jgi:DNA-binding PadR family transcriptional regulator
LGVTLLPLLDSTAEKLRKHTVKSLIDVIILTGLKNGTMSGYDVISHIHTAFGVLLSSGTVYSHLYALEREGLTVGEYKNKKRVYNITEKGINLLSTLAKNNLELLESLQLLLKK